MAHFLYLTLPGANKVLIYGIDPGSGKLSLAEDMPLPGGPVLLVADRAQRCLYAGLSSSQLASFHIDPQSGRLTPLNAVSLSAPPCFLSLDQTGRFLLSAYYGAGAAAVHPLAADGAVAAKPVVHLETAPCAHAILVDPSNRFAFVPHVARSNVIFQFLFDAQTGTLAPNRVSKVKPLPDMGPRHFVFHPAGNFAYFDNEQGSSVTAYRLDPENGTLTPFQTLSTLPAGFSEENTCAHIAIHPTGKFLYAANRGHDSIACFAVDPHSGTLTALGQQSTEKTPTHFAPDPEGRYLYVAGQGGDRLAAYHIDPSSGTLAPLEVYTMGANPYWVLTVKGR